MKATDLLKNAIVLKTEGEKGLSTKLVGLVRDIEFKGLSSIAAYVVAQLDNDRDPVVSLMREARAPEAPMKELLGSAVKNMSTFNKLLNQRFGAAGTLIMDATDPALPKVVAALPNGVVRDFRFESTPLKKLDDVFTGELAFSSYLKTLTSHLKGQHEVKKAEAELHNEVSQGEGYDSFSRMAFLRHQDKTNFSHACVFRSDETLRFATMQFLPDLQGYFAKTFYPKDIAKLFLFSHELGHCVTPDSILNESLIAYFEDRDPTAEMRRRELFADIYASCFMAKITGNWDFLNLLILPMRAAEAPDHNTFHFLRKLPLWFSDARPFAMLSDEELVRTAGSLYQQLNPCDIDKGNQLFHDAAAMMLRDIHMGDIKTEQDFLSRFGVCCEEFNIVEDEFSQERVVALLMTRLQTDIDLIGMQAQMGVPEQRIRECLEGISLAVNACGKSTVASNLMNLSRRPAQTLRCDILEYVSEGGLNSLARYEETSMSIEGFWEQWAQDEKRLERHNEPTPAGRALG